MTYIDPYNKSNLSYQLDIDGLATYPICDVNWAHPPKGDTTAIV